MAITVDESWEDFVIGCGHHGHILEQHKCEHISRSVDTCLDKKYCPRIKKAKAKPAATGWREKSEAGFALYIRSHTEHINALLSDKEFISKLEEEHPGYDIPKTIIRASDEFWGTRQGWEHKLKEKGDPDWRRTYRSNVAMKVRKGFAVKKSTNSGKSFV